MLFVSFLVLHVLWTQLSWSTGETCLLEGLPHLMFNTNIDWAPLTTKMWQTKSCNVNRNTPYNSNSLHKKRFIGKWHCQGEMPGHRPLSRIGQLARQRKTHTRKSKPKLWPNRSQSFVKCDKFENCSFYKVQCIADKLNGQGLSVHIHNLLKIEIPKMMALRNTLWCMTLRMGPLQDLVTWPIHPWHISNLRNIKRICVGKSCWRVRLAIQQLFLIQILLPFPIFKLPPNFIFQWYRPQTWQFYLCFRALFISSTHKVPGLKFKGG